MMRKFLKVLVISLIFIRLLTDMWNTQSYIEQIYRSAGDFVDNLSFSYLDTIIPYFLFSVIMVNLFKLLILILGIYGLYIFLKKGTFNRELLIYISYNVIFYTMNSMSNFNIQMLLVIKDFLHILIYLFTVMSAYLIFFMLPIPYIRQLYKMTSIELSDKLKIRSNRINLLIDLLIILVFGFYYSMTMEAKLIGFAAVILIYFIISRFVFNRTIANMLTKRDYQRNEDGKFLFK